MKHNYLLLNKGLLFLLICLGMSVASAAAQGKGKANGNPCNSSNQYLYWTGEENDDFFNENNWRLTREKPSAPKPPGLNGGSGESAKPACLPGANSKPWEICPNAQNPKKDAHPNLGTLEPGKAIDYNLWIEGAEITARGSIHFACDQKGMTVVSSRMMVEGSLEQGVLSLDGESTVKTQNEEWNSSFSVNFLDPASWLYVGEVNPLELQEHLDQVMISNEIGILDQNFRINQYYQKGAIIRPLNGNFSPLEGYASSGGAGAPFQEDIIYKGGAIPLGDNSLSSFILKRGFMVTLANNPDGTGKSKVYIASEEDLMVDDLPASMQGNVSFLRVVPWNWVTKKGTGGFFDELDAGWYYNWGLSAVSRPNYDYVPMAWGAGGASPANIQNLINKKKPSHVLGFNESDNCNGESGQFNNLCEPAVAVAYYENLMGLGVRLGSPAPRENGPTGWLREFNEIAKARDVRFDFVAVHWYDWGSGPANSPNANPQEIFNRFKAYLNNVHQIYNLPIWITEFNANPNRGNAIQEEFLKLALPYLESLDYVERYAYFQPNPNNSQNDVEPAFYYDEAGNLTNIGLLYLNHESTPSIPMPTYSAPNNLEQMDEPFVEIPSNVLAFEAECGDYLGNQWTILTDESASNGLYIKGDPSKEGESANAMRVHFEFDLESADDYRVWIRSKSVSGTAGALLIGLNGEELERVAPFNSAEFTWFQIPRFYDLGKGRHRLTLEFPNASIQLDQVAVLNGPSDLESLFQEEGACIPEGFAWGRVLTDIIDYFEAEEANQGPWWELEISESAIGGLAVKSLEGQQSLESPSGAKGILTFNFEVAEADEYEIWAKIQAKAEPEAALWISVDGEPFRKWTGLQNSLFKWYWKKFYHSYDAEDRDFSYFLREGTHEVRIGIGSGDVKVDRLAIASKGKLPEEEDPNVIAQVEGQLEFEAEDATLLGTAFVVNCGTSSNGEQVNMRNLNTNGVRFDQIITESAGTYVLNVSYMSAVSRSFRLVVNGELIGQQTVVSSGAWCFGGGSPAIYQVEVDLEAGINSIEITPFNGDAPFIDKIKLEKATFETISLEAEEAQLIGAVNVVNCVTSSNGQQVNPFSSVSNAIRFSEIQIDQAGTYILDISYMSKVNRSMNLLINGATPENLNFESSGNWCFEGGLPGIKAVEVELTAGQNSIEFKPDGSSAPFIDKISIRPLEAENLRVVTVEEPLAEQLSTDWMIYPNPLSQGNTLHIAIPEFDGQASLVQLLDMNGQTILSQILQSGNHEIDLLDSLPSGVYVILLRQGYIWQSKKLIVQ
ncbi:Por secretion system C-terminal sorting domain-containing protein [Algoriphagus faecimaris]|uniref:Por secretion system C-terminal sorting domain-containing protein n=1 Tax=Algoriphagus faecimaris TaxID=686796 RepID=A0A1G6SP71_9BACT|nr:glycosyl hydrolase [Algoriphagus faecimaris]SDD18689.1 Por secretion system C-terminal sorting domain-containing protein [Algoriphagus faecimaris]